MKTCSALLLTLTLLAGCSAVDGFRDTFRVSPAVAEVATNALDLPPEVGGILSTITQSPPSGGSGWLYTLGSVVGLAATGAAAFYARKYTKGSNGPSSLG